MLSWGRVQPPRSVLHLLSFSCPAAPRALSFSAAAACISVRLVTTQMMSAPTIHLHWCVSRCRLPIPTEKRWVFFLTDQIILTFNPADAFSALVPHRAPLALGRTHASLARSSNRLVFGWIWVEIHLPPDFQTRLAPGLPRTPTELFRSH